MIHAQLYHVIEVQMKKKGKKHKAEILKQEHKTVKISGLIGDGKSKVRRGRNARLALPYGEVAISSTCEIELTCNQDEASVMLASRRSTDMIDEILDGDTEFMENFIRRSMT